MWRAYELKEAARGIFAPGLRVDDVEILIDRLLSRLARSRLEPLFASARRSANTATGSSPRSASASTKGAPRRSTTRSA